MKGFTILLTLFATFFTAAYGQQATERAVTLKTSDGSYVGQIANGGLDASSKSVTAKQIFVLIDINGGKIADGDGVKLFFEQTLWREDAEKSVIHRVPAKIAKEKECIFTLRIKDGLIFLETASGQFIVASTTAITTTKDAKNATLFDIQTAIAPDQPTAYRVALKFADGTFLGMVAGGGLDALSKEVTTDQVFTMIDLNGGTLTSGDNVRFVFGQSQMREDKVEGKIHRVPIRGSVEAECTFRIVVAGTNILVQAPTGKYLARSADGKSVVTTEKRDETSLLTPVSNPTPTLK